MGKGPYRRCKTTCGKTFQCNKCQHWLPSKNFPHWVESYATKHQWNSHHKFRCLDCTQPPCQDSGGKSLLCNLCQLWLPSKNSPTRVEDYATKHQKNSFHKFRCMDCSHPPCQNPFCKCCPSCRNPECKGQKTCTRPPSHLPPRLQPKHLAENMDYECDMCQFPPCDQCSTPMTKMQR